ncbi:MAG TPA: MerR family transcriptional regulator [Marinagarivorans sp.]
MSQQAIYSIGVAARMSGISVHTIRMWERRYNLLGSKRTSSGQRAYSLADIDHLKLLKRLTDNGMRIGDIAKFSAEDLIALLRDQGESQVPARRPEFSVTVCDDAHMALCSGVVNQFPRYRFTEANYSFKHEQSLAHFKDVIASSATTTGASNCEQQVLLFEIPALQASMYDDLQQLKKQFSALLVATNYVHPTLKASVKSLPIIFFAPHDKRALIAALKLLESKAEATISRQQARQLFEHSDFSLPQKVFNSQQLTHIEQQKHLLDCECPPHIVELIRKLSAFEDYSQGCKAESEHQKLIHENVYAYAAQARHLMEKALLIVMAEHEAGDTE